MFDLVKYCSNCGIVQLKIKFNKYRGGKDGLYSWCISCRRIYYNETRDQRLEYGKRYNNETRDQRREYRKNRRQTDPKFKLSCNLRNRVYQAFRAQNVRKDSRTMDILGCSHTFVKDWIEFQIHVDMTLENYGKVWHIDHCLPVCSFNSFNEDEMRKCFNWNNLRPIYSKDNLEKGYKINMRFYLLQEIKAVHFL